MEKGTPQRTLRERFEARVIRSDGCWSWAGSHDRNGYAKIAVKRDGRWRPECVHRVAYELLVGPIPAGLTLDHICRNPGCVNPVHLEPVTQQVNMLRGVHPSAITVATGVCKYGHRLTPQNTVYRNNGTRECRACIKRRNDLKPRLTAPKSLRERFEAKYEVREDGCWVWTGAYMGGGYGAMRVNGRTVTAQRVAYELYVQPIRDGIRIAHDCGHRECVNPAHLRAKGGRAPEGG